MNVILWHDLELSKMMFYIEEALTLQQLVQALNNIKIQPKIGVVMLKCYLSMISYKDYRSLLYDQ
jgi:hypothetical protein